MTAVCRLICALVLMLLPALAAAQGFPALYDVTRVASNDTLNIRSGPGTRYPIIGELAHDATRIEVIRRDPATGWGLVNTAERSGWLSLSFMRPTPGAAPWDGTPSGLAWCGGTEPFWDIRMEFGSVTLSNLGTPVFTAPFEPFVGSVAGRGRAVALNPNSGGVATLVVVPEMCTDGMSDREYGLGAYVTTRLPGEGTQLWIGCCSVAP